MGSNGSKTAHSSSEIRNPVVVRLFGVRPRLLFVFSCFFILHSIRSRGFSDRLLGGACKKLRRIWVDGAYRGHLLEWVILHYRFLFQPVLRCDNQKGFVVLPRRWVVERNLCVEMGMFVLCMFVVA